MPRLSARLSGTTADHKADVPGGASLRQTSLDTHASHPLAQSGDRQAVTLPVPMETRSSKSTIVASASAPTPTEQKDLARKHAWEQVREGRSIVPGSFADAQRLSRQLVPPKARETPESANWEKEAESGWCKTDECQTRMIGVHTSKHGPTVWQEFHGAFEHVQDPGTMYVMDEETHTALMGELSHMQMARSQDPNETLRTAWEATIMDQSRIRITEDEPDGKYIGSEPRWRTDDHSCDNGGYRWWRLSHRFDSYEALRRWEDGEEVELDSSSSSGIDVESQMPIQFEDTMVESSEGRRTRHRVREDTERRHRETDKAWRESVDLSNVPPVSFRPGRVSAPENPTDEDVLLWMRSQEGRRAKEENERDDATGEE